MLSSVNSFLQKPDALPTMPRLLTNRPLSVPSAFSWFNAAVAGLVITWVSGAGWLAYRSSRLAWLKSADMLTVTQPPEQLLENQIFDAVFPWLLALASTGFLLVPLCLVFLHWAFTRDSRKSDDASAAKAEKDQEISEQFQELELVYRTAPVGLCLLDREYKFLRINSLLASFHDVPVDQHVGKTIRDILPDVADAVESVLQQVIASGQPLLGLDIERISPWDPTDLRNYLCNFFPIKNDNQQVISVSCCVQDTTERKRAVEAIRLRDHAISCSSVALIILDATTDQFPAIYCNPAYEQLTGYSRAEVLGESFLKYQPVASEQAEQVEIRDALMHRREISRTFLSHRKDGTAFWSELRLSPVHDSEGKITRMIGFQADVSQREHAAEKLRQSEARYRTLFEAAPLCIHELNTAGKLVSINGTGLKMLNAASESDIIGRSFLNFVPSDDHAKISKLFELAKQGNPADFSFRATSGQYFESCIVPLAAEPGQPGRLIGLTQDVTERKAREDFLALENELLASQATGTSISDLLLRLVRFVETQASDATAAVFLLDSENRIRVGAGPGLTTGFQHQIEGLPATEGNCPCRSTSITGQPVFVADTRTGQLDEQVRAFAASENIRSCWSTPIKDSAGEVMGSFVLYRPTSGLPNERYRILLDSSAHLCGLLLTAHRQEQTLRLSESRHRALFEQAAVGVALLEATTGKFLEINQRFTNIVGYPKNELLTLDLQKITHWQDRPEMTAMIAERDPGESLECESEQRIRRKDGSEAWVKLTISPLCDLDQQPATRIVIAEDITERKQAEQQLRWTQFSVEFCKTMIFWIQRDARFLYVNQEASQSFGYSREQWLTMSVHDIDPDYPPEAWPQYWETLRQEKQLTFETNIRHRDGSMTPVEITTDLIEFEEEEFVVAFVTDISEQKQSAEALQQSEGLFKNLVETAPFGIQRSNLEGQILFANAAMGRIFDCQPEELVGTGIWEFAVDEDAIQTIKERIRRLAFNPDEPRTFETQNRTRSGRIIDVQIDWTHDCDIEGNAIGFIVIVTDITQRLRTQRQIQASEARFRALVENSNDVISIFNSAGELAYVSPAVERVLGYRTDEFKALRPFEMLHATEFELQRKWHAERHEPSTATVRTIKRIPHKDGSIRTCELILNNRLNEPELRAMVSTLRDITDQTSAQERLRDRESQLAHVSRLSSMGEMVAGITHEIRQPLHAIANFAAAGKSVCAKFRPFVEIRRRDDP